MGGGWLCWAGLAGDGERTSIKKEARFGGREERSNSLSLVFWLWMMDIMVQHLCKPKPCACCGLGQADLSPWSCKLKLCHMMLSLSSLSLLNITPFWMSAWATWTLCCSQSREQGGDMSHLPCSCLEERAARASWEDIIKRNTVSFFISISFLCHLPSLASPGLAPQYLCCRSYGCHTVQSSSAPSFWGCCAIIQLSEPYANKGRIIFGRKWGSSGLQKASSFIPQDTRASSPTCGCLPSACWTPLSCQCGKLPHGLAGYNIPFFSTVCWVRLNLPWISALSSECSYPAANSVSNSYNASIPAVFMVFQKPLNWIIALWWPFASVIQ